jgi:hypothetical protein
MAVLYGPQASMLVNGYALSIANSGQAISLNVDEGHVPFFGASVTITRPDDAPYALLDPTKRNTVSVSIQYSASSVLVLSNLYVFSRSYDPSTDLVALDLTTEEMDTTTYSPSDELSWIDYQSSVKTIAQNVLQQTLGTGRAITLAAGAQDQSFRVFSEEHNLFPNPDIATVTGFAGASSANQISRVQASTGVWAVRSTANTTTTRVDVQYPATAPVAISASEGQQYTLSMQVRTTGTSAVTLYMQFNNNDDVTLVTVGKTIGNPGSAFVGRYFVTAVAPPNTSTITWVLRNSGNSVSGNVLDAAQVMILEGDGTDPTTTAGTPMPYFSGATGDTPDYHYGWDGDANASESYRVPITQREPEALKWQPGTTAAEFLQSILQPVGLRLFLNLDGTWKLANNGYRLDGQVRAQYGSTLYAATERVSLTDSDADGYPMNADAVILTYTWTDPVRGEQTQQDRATPAGYKRPYRLDINKPFPGPGQAAYLLARFTARKFALDVDCRPNFDARPGMNSFVSLPNRPAQSGYVQAVTWDLASARMTLTSKGFAQVLPGSVGNASTTQTIGSVTGTIGNYTN